MPIETQAPLMTPAPRSRGRGRAAGALGASLRLSRKARVGAALLIALHLFLLFMLPAAEAHEPRGVAVHVEAPGQHHMAHNPETCAICVAMQLEALPGRSVQVSHPTVAVLHPAAAEQPRARDESDFAYNRTRAPPHLS